MEKTDICVIGAGPAGLTAAIYAARANKNVLVLEMLSPGGQVMTTPDVENYPGFEKIPGWELSEKMRGQAEKCGARFLSGEVVRVVSGEKKKTVELLGGNTVECGAVILAMGAAVKQLGLKNEKELVGSGVSYCATCDGSFFRGKTVAVAGGTRIAASDVAYLCPIAARVYWIHRGSLDEYPLDFPNLTRVENAAVAKLHGNPLSSVTLSFADGRVEELALDGLFAAVGYTPLSFPVQGLVRLDEKGYVVTDEEMRTDVPGVYAAGDVRAKSFRQIVTACSDGATAAHFAVRDLPKKQA